MNQNEGFLGSEHFDNHVPPVDVNFIIPHGTGTQTLKDDCNGVSVLNYFDEIMNSYKGFSSKQSNV